MALDIISFIIGIEIHFYKLKIVFFKIFLIFFFSKVDCGCCYWSVYLFTREKETRTCSIRVPFRRGPTRRRLCHRRHLSSDGSRRAAQRTVSTHAERRRSGADVRRRRASGASTDLRRVCKRCQCRSTHLWRIERSIDTASEHMYATRHTFMFY